MSDLIERLREKARHLNTTTANLIIEAADELSRLQSLSDQNRLTGGWRDIEATDEVVRYVGRYGGFCRDCADENGVCPASGMPCGDDGKAVRHVISALNYGFGHGFIKAPPLPLPGGEEKA